MILKRNGLTQNNYNSLFNNIKFMGNDNCNDKKINKTEKINKAIAVLN